MFRFGSLLSSFMKKPDFAGFVSLDFSATEEDEPMVLALRFLLYTSWVVKLRGGDARPLRSLQALLFFMMI